MKELDRLPPPLLQWYGEHARVLPWRTNPTPYGVLVSELMLQQTRVAAVLGYYSRFVAALPTVSALAAAPEDTLMKLWQGLGYYNRARNLQRAAQQIAGEFGGVFPDCYENLLKLHGVGDYTAGAIASIAFGEAVPAVDGNVLRVCARLTLDAGDITKPETKKRQRAALLGAMPTKSAGDFNQALMELGATICLPNGAPLCQSCPAQAFCRAYLEGKTAELPIKTPKKPRRIETRAVLLLFFEGQLALRRRAAKGLLAGLWEYPNELESENLDWGITPAALSFGGTGKHIFTHIEWQMRATVARAASASLPDGWVWATAAELEQGYPLPSAFQCFAHLAEQGLAGNNELFD